MCNSGAHRLTRNSAEGQIFTQEMQLTLSNNQTLKCIRRAYSAVMHFAENATPIAFQRDCIDRVNILTSLCIRHFPFAVVGGEGKHKRLCLLSHSLPPPPSPRAGASVGLLCNKGAKHKPGLACTWTIRARDPFASVQSVEFELHTVQICLETGNFCNCSAKKAQQPLHDGPRLAAESS